MDSLRVETRDGRKFIVHEVESKETLYALSRRYNVPVDAIKEANPAAKAGLRIGQEVMIPFSGVAEVEQTPTSTATTASPKDATTHMVDVGETLYSISRLYSISVDELKALNNLQGNDLDVGQQLVVGTRTVESEVVMIKPTETAAVETAPVVRKKTSNIHIVEQKETLYSLSKRYGVTVEDLMRWNNLQDNNVSVGQQLVITGEALAATSVVVAETATANLPEEKPAPKEDTITTRKTPPPSVPILAENVVEFNSRVVKVGDLDKIFEEGMAMVIENSTDTKKYLALHREADVGTVMKVKNMMNDLSIYVRVVGRLPDTGGNDRVLLKLSRTAYERLGARDQKFPVEVSYIP